jgi:sugar O-acyltransferase (sialic acid O-acetyltransferase NeuD family)
MTQLPEAESDVLGLFGVGGFGREVMGFIRENPRWPERPGTAGGMRIYFVDMDPQSPVVNEMPVISEREFFAIECRARYFNVAIADSNLREQIVGRCLAHGVAPMTLRSRDSALYDGNQIGEGAIICAYTAITSNVVIGRYVHVSFHCYIAHDCRIGDFVTFAPRAQCNGNVHIHDHAYIGACAVIKNGTPDIPIVIGKRAIIGMGAVVTRSVPPDTTVVGVPAKPMNRR